MNSTSARSIQPFRRSTRNQPSLFFLWKRQGDRGPNSLRSYCAQVLPMSGETMMPVARGEAGRAVRGDDHAVLDDHVARFDPRIEQQRVLLGIGEVGRVAAEDAAVVLAWGRSRRRSSRAFHRRS